MYIIKERILQLPLLKCGQHTVTSFQRVECQRAGVTLQWREPANQTSARWSRLTPTVISYIDSVCLSMT